MRGDLIRADHADRLKVAHEAIRDECDHGR